MNPHAYDLPYELVSTPHLERIESRFSVLCRQLQRMPLEPASGIRAVKANANELWDLIHAVRAVTIR